MDSPILIIGESGTGKDVLAEIIHHHSSQRDKPLIKMNCGTIPPGLMDKELFETANKGILFLDEIDKMPLSSQEKLLRFLDEGRQSNVRNNLRIIAGTSQNLETMAADNRFNKNFYYRLKVIPFHLPPLRDRKDCILPLIFHYLNFFCGKFKKNGPLGLSPNAADTLEKYTYPGNVRELINICERLVVMTDREKIHTRHLPQSLMNSAGYETLFKDLQASELSHREMMETFEKQLLKNVMTKHKTQLKAANVLGLNQSTIARKLQRYNQA